MTTNTWRLIPMTDDQGKITDPEFATDEPHPGSIVMTQGVHGTAWQRQFDDGKWYRCGRGSGKTWAYLITQRNLVLVYDAALRGVRA